MPAIYHHEHTVPDEEIDRLGHVNNLHYVKWMIAAAVAHSTEQGWPKERYQEMGASWVVRKHTIEYLQPAYAGEEIVVKTWIADIHKITSLRKYEIIRPSDETLLAVAETNWVFIGLKHNVPRRVPQEFIESFELVPDDAEP